LAPRAAGLEYQVLERGVLINSMYKFPPQMVFFTTPDLLEIGLLPFVENGRSMAKDGQRSSPGVRRLDESPCGWGLGSLGLECAGISD
jgi:hypothetical protein